MLYIYTAMNFGVSRFNVTANYRSHDRFWFTGGTSTEEKVLRKKRVFVPSYRTVVNYILCFTLCFTSCLEGTNSEASLNKCNSKSFNGGNYNQENYSFIYWRFRDEAPTTSLAIASAVLHVIGCLQQIIRKSFITKLWHYRGGH